MTRTRPRILFVCGSINQTTQMHQIARALPETEAWFTPYYGNAVERWFVKAGLAEHTIAGRRLRARCLGYLEREQLAIDCDGERGGYDLCVSCSDVVAQDNLRAPMVLVQEGILIGEGVMWPIISRFPQALPRWLLGDGRDRPEPPLRALLRRQRRLSRAVRRAWRPAERLVTTGIPNFDDSRALPQQRVPPPELRPRLHLGHP